MNNMLQKAHYRTLSITHKKSKKKKSLKSISSKSSKKLKIRVDLCHANGYNFRSPEIRLVNLWARVTLKEG